VTRRTILQRLFLLIGIDAAGLIGCMSGRGAHPVPAVVGEASEPGVLSNSDLEALVAFAEVLVNDRHLSAAERGYLVQHLEDRTAQSAEYVTLYRMTARTLDRLAGRRFSSLDLRERVEFVERHHLGDPRVSPDEDLGPFTDDVRTVRKRAASDLIAGYYASPAGWAAVGYATFPGRCGDLTRYTRPEA